LREKKNVYINKFSLVSSYKHIHVKKIDACKQIANQLYNSYYKTTNIELIGT
jgi:hypothetical protein